MTTADDKITPLPTLLERIGRRIDQAWQRTSAGEEEWIEGSLELAQALAEGRERFPSNTAFGVWLKENRHDFVNKNDRAALLGLASDPTLAREVLVKTDSRSYDRIWRKVQDRFPPARKTDKPKLGRPRGTGGPRKPRQTEPVKAEIIAQSDEGVPATKIAVDVGLKPRAVQYELQMEHVRRKAQAELLDAADVKNFSEKGKLRIEDAIRIHAARLNKQFEQRVNEEVRRRIDAANDAMRSSYARLSADNINLTRIIGQRGVFTETQYKQMLMLCHPDSSASPQLKGELLQVLIEHKQRLVKQ